MFEIFLVIIGVAIGVIATNMIPALQTWGAKQATSIDKRWQALRADYEEFSVQAREEFEQIEMEARERIKQAKAKYQRR